MIRIAKVFVPTLLLFNIAVPATAQHHDGMGHDSESQDQMHHSDEFGHMMDQVRDMAQQCYRLSMDFRSMAAETSDSAQREMYHAYEMMGNTMGSMMNQLSMMSRNMQSIMSDSTWMHNPDQMQDLQRMSRQLHGMMMNLQESLHTMDSMRSRMHMNQDDDAKHHHNMMMPDHHGKNDE